MENQEKQTFDTQTQQVENKKEEESVTQDGLKAFPNKNAKNGKLICSIIGIIGGFISIILGFVVSGKSTGGWEINNTYGGDAYTGIQNAAAQTANNVQRLAEIIRTGMSSALIIFGIAMIAYFGIKYFKNKEKD